MEWAKACSPLFSKIQEFKKQFPGYKAIIDFCTNAFPQSKKINDTVVAIDPLNFITVKSTVNVNGSEKKVVLIFDDLERSRLDTIDVLGCINEYCENQGINTIIVANEDILRSNNNSSKECVISYSLIKEKIVARTVALIPDYAAVIDSVIRDGTWDNELYTDFLLDNRDLIYSLLGEDTAEQSAEDTLDEPVSRPHNIRSLKCALQDFFRLYPHLVSVGLPDLSKYLYSFVAYAMAEKGGLIEEKEYGDLFSQSSVKKLYPFFSDAKMFNTAKRWILHGAWDDEAFKCEIEQEKERTKAPSAKDLLRLNQFIDLEESVIADGFDGLLRDAYDGVLTLNEYVYLIKNSFYIRHYGISVPSEIDWDKVCAGIKTRFQINIEQQDDEGHFYHAILEDTRHYYNDNELRAYDLISSFRKGNQVVYANNRKLYINELNNHGVMAFVLCKGKRFDVFDAEMAQTTADCFERCIQADKAIFADSFMEVWKHCDLQEEIRSEETKAGFQKLLDILRKFEAQYKDDGRPIAAAHASHFAERVQELIDKLKNVVVETPDGT